jgi:hypothetical protein
VRLEVCLLEVRLVVRLRLRDDRGPPLTSSNKLGS